MRGPVDGCGAVMDERHHLHRDGSDERAGLPRLAVDFAIDGDKRFLSHQDTLRVFVRAAARGGLPVRTTQGFNPRPRIRLPFPRPVGEASDADRVVLDMHDRTWRPERVLEALGSQMPEGIRLQRGRWLDPDERSLPRQVRYRVPIDATRAPALAARAAELMRFEPIPYQRFVHKTSSYSSLDLRPYLESIAVCPQAVTFTLHVTGGGSAKPVEICDVLCMQARMVGHQIRRLEVVWH